jgi:pseudouridylate synthase
MKNICSGILSVANHIKESLNHNLPVVALESTIISHGMPYPQNKQCAL